MAVGFGSWVAPTPAVRVARAETRSTGRCGDDWSAVQKLGSLPDNLLEVSGFVSSSLRPGVAWMIQDSDNPRRLYSFELDGDQPRWKSFPVAGTDNIDWEDLAYSVGSDGRGRLWIWENAHEDGPKKLYEVLEPDPRADDSARLVATYDVEYPDGNKNTESLFTMGGRLVVVAKTSPNAVYRLPAVLSKSRTNVLERVGRLDVPSFVTAVASSADDRLLAVLTTADVLSVVETRGAPGDVAGFVDRDPIFRRSMPVTQREAVDFFPYESCDIVLVSEDGTVWRMSNPHSVEAGVLPGAPGGVRATAGDGLAVVSWLAPAGDQGISGYRVTAYQGSAEVGTVATPDANTSIVVSGLTNGVAYTFTVAAVSGAGVGAPSPRSSPVVPGAAGQAPTGPGVSSVPGELSGYWMLAADGEVFAFGEVAHMGPPAGSSASAVDLEAIPSAEGYWVVDDRGMVSAYGRAPHMGQAGPGDLRPGEAVTSMSGTPSGGGYWLFTSLGRVLAFGDADSFGDMAGVVLNGPVLDSVATPSGKGYYMVASDGGVFAFGDAVFHGSMGGTPLNAPVQSLVPDPDGAGYWLVASDGGVFAFDTPFLGSMGGVPLNRPVSGMVAFGNGYVMVAEDGGAFNFSDQQFFGSLGDRPPARPVVAVAAAR